MNDAEFLQALEDCSLPSEAFNHRNHLRAAWLYLEQGPLAEAAMKCSLAIQRYATTIGAPEKFHLTLTLALMHIIAARRDAYPAPDWEAFLESCPELISDARELLAAHYSEALLESDQARRTFVPPDKSPLPASS
ncbi:MAG: hypothetical protein R3217_04225 [Gammaproteobacteria bacterium]|nr:hypothetical protein [Gammaproteobacteria bacterium]